ncbi:MAG: hypothetical protein QF609_04630 [Gammaproteobacteria bacterium]|nr:hypothetical protein [Gammaproteobacteria bacterium]
MWKAMTLAGAIGLAPGWGPAVAADGTSSAGVQGAWRLDQSASDSFEDTLEATAERRSAGFREGRLIPDAAGFKREKKARRRRFEAVSRIAAAEAIDIAGYREVTITYDGQVTRTLAPNPNGRVYSASGDELVKDEFGYTLSFWIKGVLVVETNDDRGIKMTERYRFKPDTAQLVVSISVKSSGGKPMDVLRVFDRAGG